MRHAARTDANQPAIVDALRRVGATVEPLHRVGGGVPDLLVGFRRSNYLLEVKDGQKPPSARRLTEDQLMWHGDWRGSVTVVTSVDDALEAIGVVAVAANRARREG